MSKITLSSNASGTGTLTIASPNTSTDRTLTLPDETGTVATFDASGNIVPTTAAKGINFTANTPAAGMTSQLLNWYEEGTWTPVWSSNSTPPTISGYTQQTGTYTRIGNRVFVSCDSRAAVTAIGTGDPTITGLPFASPEFILPPITPAITNALTTLGAYRYISGSTVILSGSAYAIATNNYLSFTAEYHI